METSMFWRMRSITPLAFHVSRALLTTAAFLLVLSGCSFAPTFDTAENTELPLPETFEGRMPSRESVANTAWWDLFMDPSLKATVEATLNANRSLQVSAARVLEARALVGFVRADQFPFLDVSGSLQRADLGNAAAAAPSSVPFNDFSLSGNLSFEVDLWGKFSNATAAQRHELMASEFAYRALTISLVAQVAELYFTLIDLDNRIEIAERTLANRKSATGIITARFSKGITPMLDVNQAEIEEADARIALAKFRRERRIIENALQALQGRTEGAQERSKALPHSLSPSKLPAGIPADLLSRRPDVQAAEEAVRAEYARIGVAEAQRLPSLSLLGTFGLRSDEGSEFFEADSRSWSAGGGLFGPLFNWGKNIARVEAQNARALQARKTLEDTVIRAVAEVEDAVAAIENYDDEYRARVAQRSAAANAARLSRARYDDGVTAYLEVLDIERSLFASELGESEAHQRYLSSVVQLYKALGGGWNPAAEASAGSAVK